MARKRMVDPDIWTDEKILSLPSPLAVLLYIGTLSMADDAGRIEWSSMQLKTRLFPYRDEVNLRDIELAMAALITLPNELKHTDEDTPLLVAYTVRGRHYAYHPNWKKHQYVNRPTPSKLPAPPDDPSGISLPTNGSTKHAEVTEKAQEIPVATNGARPSIPQTSYVSDSVTFQTHGASPNIFQPFSVPLESESESESETHTVLLRKTENIPPPTRKEASGLAQTALPGFSEPPGSVTQPAASRTRRSLKKPEPEVDTSWVNPVEQRAWAIGSRPLASLTNKERKDVARLFVMRCQNYKRDERKNIRRANELLDDFFDLGRFPLVQDWTVRQLFEGYAMLAADSGDNDKRIWNPWDIKGILNYDQLPAWARGRRGA